jgi:hypothetical protein
MRIILIPEVGDRILVKGKKGRITMVPSGFIGPDPFCYADVFLDEFEGDDAVERKVVWFHGDTKWDTEAKLWRAE